LTVRNWTHGRDEPNAVEVPEKGSRPEEKKEEEKVHQMI
jgi:hypothetical protein